jgi:hypothetical protein
MNANESFPPKTSGQPFRESAVSSGLATAHRNSARRTRRSHGKNLRLSACSAGKKTLRRLNSREAAERPSDGGHKVRRLQLRRPPPFAAGEFSPTPARAGIIPGDLHNSGLAATLGHAAASENVTAKDAEYTKTNPRRRDNSPPTDPTGKNAKTEARSNLCSLRSLLFRNSSVARSRSEPA